MSHVPVLLEESIEALAIEADDTIIDGTYGRGGHAMAILEQLGPKGRLLVIDQDPEAVAHARQKMGSDPRVVVEHANFEAMVAITQRLGWFGQVDGILLDLGVSSPQLDEAERGFSFMADGPLDMRMNTEQGQSAAQWLSTVEEATLADVIKQYGEERLAKRIARAIVQARAKQPIETTAQLAHIVASVVKGRPGHHPATRTFQAIRILINRELDVLKTVLQDVIEIIKPGGRVAVISFHSLEDRLVKHTWQALSKPPAASRRDPAPIEFTPKLKWVGKPITASEEAIRDNPRARSARLRVVERLSEVAA